MAPLAVTPAYLDNVIEFPPGMDDLKSRRRERSSLPRSAIRAVSTEMDLCPLLASKTLTESPPSTAENCAPHWWLKLWPQQGGGRTTLEELEGAVETLKKKHRNSPHPRLGEAYNRLGTYHFHRGDFIKARDAYDKALECYKLSYAPRRGSGGSCSGGRHDARGSSDIATTFGNIGAVLWRTGRAGAAVAYLEQALHMQEKGAGGPADAAHTLYNLGNARRLRGEHREALRALKLARAAYGRVGGPAGLDVAPVEDAMGAAYAARGRGDRALRCHREALDVRTANLDPQHPAVLASMVRVAAACSAVGRLDEAEETLQEVKCAQTLALYEEKDPERLRAVAMDLGATSCLIRKVRWQKGFRGCMMPTIKEEQEE